MIIESPRAEPEAKAALLSFLREESVLTRKSAVSLELILDKYAVRVDVALCDNSGLHCFEIKTERDSLARLDHQIASYSRHADLVSVVAATKHISAVLSRVPEHVGVYEMLMFTGKRTIRVERQARRSPEFDASAMLSLLPVTELQDRLLGGRRALNRAAALEQIDGVPADIKRSSVLSFLHERYHANTLELLKQTRRRDICPADLRMLKRWTQLKRESSAAALTSTQHSVDGDFVQDREVFRHVGRCFGPVPPEIQALLDA